MKKLNPKIELNNGTIVSVQASQYHYCEPREDKAEVYDSVEIGFPTTKPPEYILSYAEDEDNPCETVYGYVPVRLVERWFNECGGIKSGKLP